MFTWFKKIFCSKVSKEKKEGQTFASDEEIIDKVEVAPQEKIVESEEKIEDKTEPSVKTK